jgi:hypothetical protein
MLRTNMTYSSTIFLLTELDQFFQFDIYVPHHPLHTWVDSYLLVYFIQLQVKEREGVCDREWQKMREREWGWKRMKECERVSEREREKEVKRESGREWKNEREREREKDGERERKRWRESDIEGQKMRVRGRVTESERERERKRAGERGRKWKEWVRERERGEREAGIYSRVERWFQLTWRPRDVRLPQTQVPIAWCSSLRQKNLLWKEKKSKRQFLSGKSVIVIATKTWLLCIVFSPLVYLSSWVLRSFN